MDTDPARPSSSSSGKMEESRRSEAILALGRKLVEELQLEPSVDTLGRWMAHYLAGLLDTVENSAPEEVATSRQECRDTILKLWSHRAELPSGHRPFQDIEPILRAVESLDPVDTTPRYFRNARDPARDEETPETKQWLEMADELDGAAKLLIGHCLSQAAQIALDKSKAWVAAAKAASLDQGADIVVVRYLSALDKTPDLADKARKVLEDRIKRLEAFKAIAEELVKELKAQVDNLPARPLD